MDTPAIDITQLVMDYASPDGTNIRVLDLPRLELPASQELAIAGPSGSGKTTLFNIVAGLLLPSSGDVVVLGEHIGRLSEAQRDHFRARSIGYIFQTSNLLGGFSALENVLLALRFADSVPRAKQRQRAQELLEQVGLAERMRHRPAQLSSGQQQRVAIARALANRPALILADEPTAHVDYETGTRVVDLLRATCAEHHAALLLASHDRDLLASCPRVVNLRGQAQQPRSDEPIYAAASQGDSACLPS